jgi:hypothetical protein
MMIFCDTGRDDPSFQTKVEGGGSIPLIMKEIGGCVRIINLSSPGAKIVSQWDALQASV